MKARCRLDVAMTTDMTDRSTVTPASVFHVLIAVTMITTVTMDTTAITMATMESLTLQEWWDLIKRQ